MPKTAVKKNNKLENRISVVQMRLSGQTYKEIQNKTGKHKNYVRRWVERFKKNGAVFNAKRKNKGRKISIVIKKKICKLIKTNNRSSCRNVAKRLKSEDIDVSKTTVHKILKESGYKNVSPQKKPALTQKQQKSRFDFAKMHESKKSSFWRRVIFSDESPF